jgi:hypothetical protein
LKKIEEICLARLKKDASTLKVQNYPCPKNQAFAKIYKAYCFLLKAA